MKSIWNILIVLIILSSQSFAAKLQPINFRYKILVEKDIKKGELYRINLSPAVLQNCASGQPDIRIFYSDGLEIPYVMVQGKYLKRVDETYSTKIIEYQTDKNSAILVFKIIGEFNPISSIELSVPDKNFRKEVELQGSNDAKKWIQITRSSIYDFSSQIDLRKTKLEFPASNYRFYRMKLGDTGDLPALGKTIALKYDGIDFRVSGGKGSKLRIDRVTAHTGGTNSLVETYDEKSYQPSSSGEMNDNLSYVIINSGLPFDLVEFDITDTFFLRTFVAYYSDTDKKNSYHTIASGNVCRFPSSWQINEKVAAKISSPGHAFYRFVFQNKNNPPLNIKQVKLKWLRRSLYFIAPTDSRGLTISFSRPNTKKPIYDIENFVNQDNWQKRTAETLLISEPTLTKNYDPELPTDRKSKTEKKVLIGIMLIIAVGISFWLYALMKKVSVKQPTS